MQMQMSDPRREGRRTYLNKYEKRPLNLILRMLGAGGRIEGGDLLILLVSNWCSCSLLSGPIARLVPGMGQPLGALALLVVFAQDWCRSHRCHALRQLHDQSLTLRLFLHALHLQSLSRSSSWNAWFALVSGALQCGHWKMAMLKSLLLLLLLILLALPQMGRGCWMTFRLESHPTLPLRLGMLGVSCDSPDLNLPTCLLEMR